MLQDLVSAKLISDYTVVQIPNFVNDLQGTDKVRNQGLGVTDSEGTGLRGHGR